MATDKASRRQPRPGMKTAPSPKPGEVPANRRYVFAKNCTNDFGTFQIGDSARGAFPRELVDFYVAAGILLDRG